MRTVKEEIKDIEDFADIQQGIIFFKSLRCIIQLSAFI